MHITQVQLKMIAIGLIAIFLILPFIMPNSTTTSILLAVVMIAALVIALIGWLMEKRDAGKNEDLLTIPPKRS
ncbi:MAG: hypothetical protein WCH85_06620 [Methanomicrobiales archaeon]